MSDDYYAQYENIDWADWWSQRAAGPFRTEAGSEKSRQMWNERAASFAHKPKRSDYIHQLIELLALAPGQSVLDAGCGSGTLAIPLAKAGHDIVALDFSPNMLAELEQSAKEASVEDRITVVNRSWQEDWDDVPAADVAVSSRSLITDDLDDAIGKLESHARTRVVITTGAGDLPFRDHRILEAMGRKDEASEANRELILLVNYLFARGRSPRIDYINAYNTWHRATREELVESILRGHSPDTAEEEDALQAFLDEHIVYNEEEQRFKLDFSRINRWAYLEWSVAPDEPDDL